MSLLQEYITDLAPLFACGVDASRIVGACVKEYCGTVRKGIEGIEQGMESQSNGLGVVVWVCNGLNTDIAEDSKVINYMIQSQKVKIWSGTTEIYILQVGSLMWAFFSPLKW